MNEGLLVPVLMYECVTVTWKEKERSRIRAVQFNNLRGFVRYTENRQNTECSG